MLYFECMLVYVLHVRLCTICSNSMYVCMYIHVCVRIKASTKYTPTYYFKCLCLYQDCMYIQYMYGCINKYSHNINFESKGIEYHIVMITS